MAKTAIHAPRVRSTPGTRRESTANLGFAIFDTMIGRCGIAWNDRGIVGMHLPQSRESELRADIFRTHPGIEEAVPPRAVQKAITGVSALARGEKVDLSHVRIDTDLVSPFHKRVYDAARRIPWGKTCSYGELATMLDSPRAARAVGQALRRNPYALIVPCHRVLSGDGRIGGFSANGGIATKLRLLTIETDRPRAGSKASSSGRPFPFDPDLAIRHLRRCDPVLARVIDAAGPFQLQLRRTSSVFAALAESIVHQKLSGKAAMTIFARLCALFPYPHEGITGEQILSVPDRKLRAAGLSRQKILSLRDLARQTTSGAIPALAEMETLDNDVLVRTLTKVRGIGKWTVEMLLIFRLGRPDVLPLDDYGIRHGFSLAFRRRALPSRAELARRGELWKPYRSVASWYLWRAVDLERD